MKVLVVSKVLVDNTGIFRVQQVRSPYVDTGDFPTADNFDLLMFSSKSSSKSNLRRVFLFFRRTFYFEDDLEENIRRSN